VESLNNKHQEELNDFEEALESQKQKQEKEIAKLDNGYKIQLGTLEQDCVKLKEELKSERVKMEGELARVSRKHRQEMGQLEEDLTIAKTAAMNQMREEMQREKQSALSELEEKLTDEHRDQINKVSNNNVYSKGFTNIANLMTYVKKGLNSEVVLIAKHKYIKSSCMGRKFCCLD